MIDTIRAVFTYGIALVVIVGGGIYIYTHGTDPDASSTLVVVAGFMGSALTFAFGQEVQTRTARQAASQTLAASVAPATSNGHGLDT